MVFNIVISVHTSPYWSQQSYPEWWYNMRMSNSVLWTDDACIWISDIRPCVFSARHMLLPVPQVASIRNKCIDASIYEVPLLVKASYPPPLTHTPLLNVIPIYEANESF